jgi:hypothetical protein
VPEDAKTKIELISETQLDVLDFYLRFIDDWMSLIFQWGNQG